MFQACKKQCLYFARSKNRIQEPNNSASVELSSLSHLVDSSSSHVGCQLGSSPFVENFLKISQQRFDYQVYHRQY